MARTTSDNNRPLQARVRQILEHIERNRLTTHAVLRHLLFPGQKLNTLVKLTRRLCRTGYLQKFPLVPPQVYFVLGPTAVRQLGLPMRRTAPLGPQALPIQYAVLAFATLSRTHHQRLTTAELQTRYPWLRKSLTAVPHCLDESDTNRPCLELVRVDLGAATEHVIRKCDCDIERRLRFPQFQELLRTQQFRLVVITGTADKAAAIRAAVNLHRWPDGLSIHLTVVTDLLPLLSRTVHAT